MSERGMSGGLHLGLLLAALAALAAGCREPQRVNRPAEDRRETTATLAGPGEPPPPPEGTPPPPPDETSMQPGHPREPKRAVCPLRHVDEGDRTLDCPIFECGNAARVHGAHVAALDTSGAATVLSPYRIVRGSLTQAGGGCRGVTGLSLEVRDGGFVGVSGGAPPGAPPVVKCTGLDLEGARFKLEGAQGQEPVTIEIADMKQVTTWVKGDRPQSLPAYDLVIHAPPRRGQPATGRQPLCPSSATESDTHAVLIQGETYDRGGAVAQTGPSWFNIGCAGSALSKLRLLGFDPMDGKSTATERQATLRMLTGRYCRGWISTRDGTSIYPVRHGSGPGAARSTNLGAAPAPERVGPIESRWGADGALCISHLRLWSTGDACLKQSEEAWLERIRTTCGIPACDETLPCDAAAGASGPAIWSTCTIDHIPHTTR